MQYSKYKDSANFTPIPNAILDEWMCILSVYEFKVLMCICAYSFSTSDVSKTVTIGDIEKYTNFSKRSIMQYTDSLIKYELIKEYYQEFPADLSFSDYIRPIKQWEINPNFPKNPDMTKLLSK